MGMLLYLIIIVIDVLVVIDILKSSKDFEKKLLWMVVVIFLPILGPVLYYFIGRK